MCGNVAYWGFSNGITKILNALALLAYRAPDSSGMAMVGPDGAFVVRRCVGDSQQLQALLAAAPFPPLLHDIPQVVVGHGRWAMVGAVTESNAHPFMDRGRNRLVVENGSHNATLMLGARAQQEAWWRAHGLPPGQPVHRSHNTTEVLAFAWEQMALQLAKGDNPPGSAALLARLDEQGIHDSEERALRLAVNGLREGNAHACVFYHRHQPDTLYVTSHHKPIAIACRTHPDGWQELMVASDVNAALMLWPQEEVDAAAEHSRQAVAGVLTEPQRARSGDRLDLSTTPSPDNPFTVQVIFLDNDIGQGESLFARIAPSATDPTRPDIQISHYDGTPLAAAPVPFTLNPAMVGKQGHPTFTECHIHEIPAVLDEIVQVSVPRGRVQLDAVWRDGQPFTPGLNVAQLQTQFGPQLEQLHRILLIGEGSSWRDGQAAAPLFRELLPHILTIVYRPVAWLNLGETVNPAHDLAVEISWSGTTDSLLKVDSWLAELGVLRLAMTGRAQSDLGRRTLGSGGTLDARTGIERSVATVKGYAGLLLMLDLLALQLAQYTNNQYTNNPLKDELALVVPRHVRDVVEDEGRRGRIRHIATHYRQFNKVALIGNSPIDIEAELKIEELAQVLAAAFDFHDASLRPLIERTALMPDDSARVLFILNATNPAAIRDAAPLLHTLRELAVACLVHTVEGEHAATWQTFPNVTLFTSPQVSPALQPLVDAPFFFDLAVALAYARGLTPEAIDRPRNLAKSVTTTGAERRTAVELRREFHNITREEFGMRPQPPTLWQNIALPLRSTLSILHYPLPLTDSFDGVEHLVVYTNLEATENGAQMAAAAWYTLLQIDTALYRRFIGDVPRPRPDSALLRVQQAGASLAIHDSGTLSLPDDLSPLQLELLTALTLSGIAVRVAQQRGVDTIAWEATLTRLPLVLAAAWADKQLKHRVRRGLLPLVRAGYDKVQVIGGGQDFAAATSIARSLRQQGFLAEALYTDSAWHGPLAVVGGPTAETDCLIIILATDPLFQAAALVDTQVYRTRHAQLFLVVPEGNEQLPAVQGVEAKVVIPVPAVPAPFTPLINAILGDILAREMARLWQERGE